MHRACRRVTLCLLSLAFLVACESETESALTPFRSDGCSLFPDASLINQQDWCSCCVQHDIAYWQGGTASQREQADLQLKQCVADKTANTTLANVMYQGVRLGGSPYFYTWYRWGYGWQYARKYQALTSREQVQVQRNLNEYGDAGNARCQ